MAKVVFSKFKVPAGTWHFHFIVQGTPNQDQERTGEFCVWLEPSEGFLAHVVSVNMPGEMFTVQTMFTFTFVKPSYLTLMGTDSCPAVFGRVVGRKVEEARSSVKDWQPKPEKGKLIDIVWEWKADGGKIIR